jgi:hypothetical protein
MFRSTTPQTPAGRARAFGASGGARLAAWATCLALSLLLLVPAVAEARADLRRTTPPPARASEPEPEAPAELEDEPAAGDQDDSSLSGFLRLSNQFVDRTDRRLVVAADGTVQTQKQSENGVFGAYSGNLAGYAEKSLTDNWMLIVRNELRLDHFDPERVNSERYGFLDNSLRVDLGTMVGEATLLDTGVFWDQHHENFAPAFRSSSLGADLTLDRELSGYRNFWGTLEARRTTFDGLPAEDHEQLRLVAGFFRYFPETLRLEILPVPVPGPRREKDRFEYASDLELGNARKHMLDLGAGRMAGYSREPEPVTRIGRLFRDHVDRHEMAYGLTAAYASREADAGGASSFRRGTLQLFARRVPRERVVWTLEDQLDYTDRDAEDAPRYLYDQLDNRVSLERARVGTGTTDLLRGSVETTVTRRSRNYNTGRLVLEQYSYRHFGRRYGFTSWLLGYLRLNRSSVLDYQAREGFKSGNTFTVEFGPRSALDLSVMYERMAVQDVQTEFDSTYAQLAYELRFVHRLSAKARAELGFRQETERHQVFFQNNRDESIAFVDFVVRL